MENIFDYTKISDMCIKCGKCIQVCTVYKVHPDETTSPRGFIDLLGAYKRGELELDKETKNIFESCFLCTNCVDICPNELQTDMIIEQVRKDIGKKFGIAWYKRLAFFFLRNRKIMDIAARIGYIFVPCVMKIDERRSSMFLRSIPLIKYDRLFPSLAKKSFLNSQPEEIIYNGGKGKIGLFIGCLANYMYTDIGVALLKVLKILEVDVYLIKQQKCCGAPSYFTGDFKSVDVLAKFNIEYIEGFMDELDAIIIPEATCSAMIKVDYMHFFHDQPEWYARAKEISPYIHMATDWLYHNTDLKKILAEKGIDSEILVTYHDACHAKKVQGIEKEPRELLEQNYPMVEMEDSNQCCGFGGVTIQIEKFYLAQAAGKPKAKMIADTKAQIVSAECSACRMQIGNALHEAKVDVIFKNPIELIAAALENE